MLAQKQLLSFYQARYNSDTAATPQCSPGEAVGTPGNSLCARPWSHCLGNFWSSFVPLLYQLKGCWSCNCLFSPWECWSIRQTALQGSKVWLMHWCCMETARVHLNRARRGRGHPDTVTPAGSTGQPTAAAESLLEQMGWENSNQRGDLCCTQRHRVTLAVPDPASWPDTGAQCPSHPPTAQKGQHRLQISLTEPIPATRNAHLSVCTNRAALWKQRFLKHWLLYKSAISCRYQVPHKLCVVLEHLASQHCLATKHTQICGPSKQGSLVKLCYCCSHPSPHPMCQTVLSPVCAVPGIYSYSSLHFLIIYK